MLVFGSAGILQVTEKNIFIGSVEASSGTNVTWEMVNQSIEQFKIWFENNVWISINSSISDIRNRLWQIELNITSLTVGAKEDILSYLEDRLNVTQNITVTLDDIVLEGVNETNIIAKLNEISSMLGYSGKSSTVYDDMSMVILGLIDKNGDYILRNDTGVSSFYFLGKNQVELSANQKTIVDKIIIEHNATRNLDNKNSAILQDGIAGATSAAKNAGGDGILAQVGAFCAIFIVMWIIFLKRYLTNKGILSSPNQYEYDSEQNQEITERKLTPEEKLPDFSRNPVKVNPLKLKEGEHPMCYRDGETYDILNHAQCNYCPYNRECEATMIQHRGELEERFDNDRLKAEQELKEKQPIGPDIAEIMDLNRW